MLTLHGHMGTASDTHLAATVTFVCPPMRPLALQPWLQLCLHGKTASVAAEAKMNKWVLGHHWLNLTPLLLDPRSVRGDESPAMRDETPLLDIELDEGGLLPIEDKFSISSNDMDKQIALHCVQMRQWL